MEHNKIKANEMSTEKTQREQLQKDRIVRYWTQRSDEFALQREAELCSDLHGRWLKLITDELPKTGGEPLQVLDVGTGTGFFAILLSQEGFQVTGVDLTASMIDHAGKLARRYHCDVDFRVMDAENLDFQNESFDVVISRNLTWTLPNPENAYQEWMRVLKKGGILLNYDADYGSSCFTKSEQELPKEHAHRKLSQSVMQECQAIKDGLEISQWRRPGWDEQVLRSMGYQNITVRSDISGYIYQKVDEFYNPDPLFLVRAVKE